LYKFLLQRVGGRCVKEETVVKVVEKKGNMWVNKLPRRIKR